MAIRTFGSTGRSPTRPSGIVVALIFIGLPFVVRTVQPVLEEFEQELEEAAATLGANRFQTITRDHPAAADAGHPHRVCARPSRARSASTAR